MAAEKIRVSNEHGPAEEVSASREALEAQRRIAEQLQETNERSGEERSHEQERAGQEALEQATLHEKRQKTITAPERNTEQKRPRTKSERNASYRAIMQETRTHMPAPQRAFSKFIHAPAVEVTSDVVGKTVARPNSILAGSATAFTVVLTTYLVARYFGYALSGSETIIAFAGGWVLGILIDYLRVLITGRTQ